MAESAVTKKLGANPTRKEILANWTPEDPVFWKKFGERIAKQNIYTSTWALVLSFDDGVRHIRPARLLHRHRRRQLLRLDGQHRLLLPEGA